MKLKTPYLIALIIMLCVPFAFGESEEPVLFAENIRLQFQILEKEEPISEVGIILGSPAFRVTELNKEDSDAIGVYRLEGSITEINEGEYLLELSYRQTKRVSITEENRVRTVGQGEIGWSSELKIKLDQELTVFSNTAQEFRVLITRQGK